MRRFSFQPAEVLIILSSFILIKAEFLELTDSRVATPQQLRSLRPCFVEGYWEDPDDCRRFYRCVNYGTSESSPLLFRHDFDCAPGTIFDSTYGICNHPLRVTNRRSSCVFPLQLQLLHQFQEYSPRGRSPTASSITSSNLNFENIETDSNVNAEPDSNSILGLRSNFGGSRRQGKSRKFTIPPALAASTYNRIQIPVQFLPDNYYTYGEPTILTNTNTNTNFDTNTYRNPSANTNFNLNLRETQPLFSSKSKTDEDDDGLFKIKSAAAVQGKFSRRLLEKLERKRAENENINSSIQTIVQKDDETIRKKLFGGRRDNRDDESQEGEFSENVTVSTLPENNNNNNKKKNNTSSETTSNSKYFTTSAKENVVSLLPFKRYQVQIPYTK